MDKILNDFLTTALWATVWHGTEDDEYYHLDERYSIEDIDDKFKAQAKSVCVKFMKLSRNLFNEHELDNNPIGHDLWLTIHGHGAGFWDGDYQNGDKLTQICRSFSELENELVCSVEQHQVKRKP